MNKNLKFCICVDIESYTRIKEKIGDDVWRALKVYQDFIEQYINWFNGESLYSKEQKNVILFNDPFQALRFANSIQVGLFELDWPQSLINTEEGSENESYRGFRVKIGIDSSEKSIQVSEEVSKICNPGRFNKRP